MVGKPIKNRRNVQFASLDNLVSDAERMLSGHATLGNWTLGQICQHLAKNVEASLDGFGFQAPWFARWFIAPLVKKSMISKTLTPGFRLPRQAHKMLPDEDVSPEVGLRQLRQALERLRQETPTSRHPFLGRLTPAEWLQLHLRHAELHFSYVIPKPA